MDTGWFGGGFGVLGIGSLGCGLGLYCLVVVGLLELFVVWLDCVLMDLCLMWFALYGLRFDATVVVVRCMVLITIACGAGG